MSETGYFLPDDREEILLIMERAVRAGGLLQAERLEELLGENGMGGILSVSPSGGACLCFSGSMVLLLTPGGIRPVMEDPFLREGESAVFRVQWDEERKLVRFEMRQIVHRLSRSALCDYSGADCRLTLSGIQQDD